MKDTKANRELAYRKRMGIVGFLHQCICLHPIHAYETESRHDVVCPCHALYMQMEGVNVVVIRMPAPTNPENQAKLATNLAERELAAKSRPLVRGTAVGEKLAKKTVADQAIDDRKRKRSKRRRQRW